MFRNPCIARIIGVFPIMLLLAALHGAVPGPAARDRFLNEFLDPPREFSVMPFWFWNDDLQDREIIRQIADFENHGVYGFVIHPRIGLPKEIGWMSPRLIRSMRLAIEEAERRRMHVVLYDEGMYPSGSASGQVVACNPGHAARGLAKIELEAGEKLSLRPDWKLVKEINRSDGRRSAIVERPSGGVIRGLHYLGEETGRIEEDEPPAADILNPEAVDSFIRLVYDRYAREFGAHFGKTVLGIFTDEPSPLGRGGVKGMLPGNLALLPRISRILGYDIEPHLADLWDGDSPDSIRHRTDYFRAIGLCLEESYYRRLSRWCSRHHVALTGHPASSMDIGAERFFQIPGQDLVWRYVLPGKTALEGEHSTMAKCASSAMIHLKRRRNANELYGAYGHGLTFAEMQWLAGWALVRGQNLLYPHAFYYSVRGPRRDERPPDVGPNAAWWGQYKPYADFCRRLSWLNTDSRHIAEVAILADADRLPDRSAKACYQHQIDFNYLEFRHLGEEARIGKDGLHIAGMIYRAVILDGQTGIPERAMPAMRRLDDQGRVILWRNSAPAVPLRNPIPAAAPEELAAAVRSLTPPDIRLQPATENIRLRHVVKNGWHVYMLFNEEDAPASATVAVSVPGEIQWLDPFTGRIAEAPSREPVRFDPFEMKVLRVIPESIRPQAPPQKR